MAEKVVHDWLAENKVASPNQVPNFSRSYRHHDELLQAIVNVLEDRPFQHELLEPVCNQLFTLYREANSELRWTPIQFFPALIGTYLISLNRAIESLLVSIYNWEVVDQSGNPKKQTFRLPNLTQPSIYHEMMSMSSAVLTENALSRLDKGDPMIVTIGPFPQIEAITAHNRMRVMTVLMKVYNNHLTDMSKTSLHSLCKISTRVVKQGFTKGIGLHQRAPSFGSKDPIVGLSSANIHPRSNPRIPLSPQFLMEILHAVYFAMFNGLAQNAIQSLDDIHVRATHELFADVLLVTNAIRSSLKLSPAGQPTDGPMGISIALSPTTTTSTLSKSIITNASFRTKKLPDDIPIQPAGDQPDVQALTVISEESEEGLSMEKGRSALKVKSSMVSLISRKVDKNKASRKEAAAQNAASDLPSTGSSSNSSLNVALQASGVKSGKDPSSGKGDEKPKKEKEAGDSISTSVGAGAGAAAASIKKLFLIKPQVPPLGYKQQNGEASGSGASGGVSQTSESVGGYRSQAKGIVESVATELKNFTSGKKDHDREHKTLSFLESGASANATSPRLSSKMTFMNSTYSDSMISSDSMGYDTPTVNISGSSGKVNSTVHTVV